MTEPKLGCLITGTPSRDCGIEYEHITFSPNQARQLAKILTKQAKLAECPSTS